MSKDTTPPKEQIKVTDKRIFTAEGDIREEFRQQVGAEPAKPVERAAEPLSAPPPETPAPVPPASASPAETAANAKAENRRVADRAENPGTPFTNFLESLILQAYMSLGMLRNPYQPQTKVDAAAARQMIDILTLLQEKTSGNLSPDEEDFMATHLGELKLAFVQRTKTL